MARIIAAVTPFVSPIVPLSFFGGTASRIRAMPSARALLVASLLTEPPYGCLGPSGNDRYRKRSLRSQQWGLRKSTAKSRRLFRNESATSRRVRACSMTRIAFCRKSPRVPRVSWLGSWALEPATVDGKGKARPSVRRMWLMVLRFYETTREGMPSVHFETSDKSTHRGPSVFRRMR